MADLVEVSISVAGDADDLSRVAATLRASGIDVQSVLDTIGTITARCREDQIAAVSSIPGVAGVERQRSFELPGPDEPQ
jgi:hypothetical protein